MGTDFPDGGDSERPATVDQVAFAGGCGPEVGARRDHHVGPAGMGLRAVMPSAQRGQIAPTRGPTFVERHDVVEIGPSRASRARTGRRTAGPAPSLVYASARVPRTSPPGGARPGRSPGAPLPALQGSRTSGGSVPQRPVFGCLHSDRVRREHRSRSIGPHSGAGSAASVGRAPRRALLSASSAWRRAGRPPAGQSCSLHRLRIRWRSPPQRRAPGCARRCRWSPGQSGTAASGPGERSRPAPVPGARRCPPPSHSCGARQPGQPRPHPGPGHRRCPAVRRRAPHRRSQGAADRPGCRSGR